MTPRPPTRDGYSPALRRFLEDLEASGLAAALLAKRASTEQVFALAGLGLVSTSSIKDGEPVWRLRTTRLGGAVRRLLLAEAARA